MARKVNEAEFSARRAEILQVARRLIYTRGYDAMSIQDILDEVGISKGAFYHYFDSKAEVLEALTEQMIVEQVEPFLVPIVQDPQLSASEKFQRYLDSAVQWKTSEKAMMVEIARVWRSDANAIVRQKMYAISLKRVVPLLSEIIRQGVREGVFTTPYPEYIGQAAVHLIQGLGDTFVDLLFSHEGEQQILQRAETLIAVYSDVLERVLGAPAGSIHLMDVETLREWFLTNEVAPAPIQSQ